VLNPVISKDFDILKKTNSWACNCGIRHLFFGFDSETVIGDGFTRFANSVSVSLVKQAISLKPILKPKLEPVSVSTNGLRHRPMPVVIWKYSGVCRYISRKFDATRRCWLQWVNVTFDPTSWHRRQFDVWGIRQQLTASCVATLVSPTPTKCVSNGITHKGANVHYFLAPYDSTSAHQRACRTLFHRLLALFHALILML